MSILITGMEMPIDCTECWFRKAARHEHLVDCQICPLTGDTTPYTKRKDNCPLVPVPPHGDLINRNAASLTDFEIVMCGGDYKEGMKMLLQKVMDAPTIIPAEPKEEA